MRTDLTGKQFGHLTVLGFGSRDKWRKALWKCRCVCGNEINVRCDSLKTGNTKSCGCLTVAFIRDANVTHGRSSCVEYKSWQYMKDRCYNENHVHYNYYGGRGISVCDRWLNSFDNFYEDMGDRPSKKHTIDRIDNDKGYEPSNCRWATREQQSRNQRLNKNNKSGISGVHWHKAASRWYSTISDLGQSIVLYAGLDFLEACCARKSAEISYGYHENHGRKP